ncbi:MAG: alpha-galactosidase [Bryobacteraceae bacterium]
MRLRPFALFLLLAPGAPGGSRIQFDFDARFHAQPRWGGAPANIVAFDPAVQDGIEVNGWTLADFAVQSKQSRAVEDAQFGPGAQIEVRGTARRGELRIERRTRVLLPDRFPDAAILQTVYRNAGQAAVRVGSVRGARLLLDRRLADPAEAPYAFASFQGGAYKWGNEYAIIPLTADFRQSNFQGLDDRTGPEGEGGGIPLVDVWAPGMGVAVAHIETRPEWVSLPVIAGAGGVEIGISETPLAKFKQKEWLQPGEEFSPVTAAMIFHRGDFYDALATYAELLRARGLAIPRTSPPSAYEPYWKSWGFQFDFTQEKILAMLPHLKELGIRVANLDDGWFDWYGDWQPKRVPGKFPGGGRDMIAFVAKIHAAGFKTAIWWYPLGVSPESRMAKEHPDLLIQDERGDYPLDDRGVRKFCPAYEPARREIENAMRRFLTVYGFDGVYVDSTGLTAAPPCYNPAHRHASPLDSFREAPRVFELIQTTLRLLRADPWLDVCLCGLPHSPFNMPYYWVANASDPLNSAQMRRRVKVEKALRGPTFCVGDCYQVPADQWTGASIPEDFESAMGTGAQVTTFYTKLDDRQDALWRKWLGKYRELQLAAGEYLNLYDLAFDKPEIHVVRKGADLYYGIFAEAWSRKRRIELRGLDPKLSYQVYDYANGRTLGTVSGAKPYFMQAFKSHLLLRLRPSTPPSGR